MRAFLASEYTEMFRRQDQVGSGLQQGEPRGVVIVCIARAKHPADPLGVGDPSELDSIIRLVARGLIHGHQPSRRRNGAAGPAPSTSRLSRLFAWGGASTRAYPQGKADRHDDNHRQRNQPPGAGQARFIGDNKRRCRELGRRVVLDVDRRRGYCGGFRSSRRSRNAIRNRFGRRADHLRDHHFPLRGGTGGAGVAPDQGSIDRSGGLHRRRGDG